MGLCIEEAVCKGCGICVSKCPAKILAISGRRNAKGAEVVEVTEEEKCTACGSCQDLCPDLAIWVCNE